MPKKESRFKRDLKKKLSELFPGCVILNNDPNRIQGIPDLLVLYEDRWAMLEAKDEEDADAQPNQPYYVNKLNRMSFAAFIYPENEEEVLNELQKAFGIRRTTRISLRE